MSKTFTVTETTTSLARLRQLTTRTGVISSITHSIGPTGTLAAILCVEDGLIVNISVEVADVLGIKATTNGNAVRVDRDDANMPWGVLGKTPWATNWLVPALSEALYERPDALTHQVLR